MNLDLCKMDIESSDLNSCLLPPTAASTAVTTAASTIFSMSSGHSRCATEPIPIGGRKISPNCTPTNISPIITPKTTSPDHQLPKMADPKFIDQYVGQRLMEEKTRTNTYGGLGPPKTPGGPGVYRHFFNGLDTIPEYQVTDPPSTFQPLVPPLVPVPKVATTSYNISFPTTLQPRDRFDIWRNQGAAFWAPVHTSSARFSSGTGSSCSSVPHSPGSSVTVSMISISGMCLLIVEPCLIFKKAKFLKRVSQLYLRICLL